MNGIKLGVSGILFYPESQTFLLGKRMNNDTQGGMWVTAGGGVEFQEEIDAALIREYKEEVLLNVRVIPGFTSIQSRIIEDKHIVMVFKQVDFVKGYTTVAKAGDGFSEVRLFSWEEITQLWTTGLTTEMTYKAIVDFANCIPIINEHI